MSVSTADRMGITTRISGWTLALAAFVLGVVVLLAAYWQTAASLVHVWEHDGTYQYAFLIFPLSICVAWTLREKVRAHAPAPSVWGLAAVAGLVCIWYAGHVLDVNLPQHVAFIAMFPALVLACWGWRALWTLKFPLAYLVFAVPWGDAMVGPLQDITARLAVHALDLTSTPVLLNGREIVTPTAVWMVAEACSGVKFFIACTALGCLFAYLMYTRAWKRVLFVVLAAVVPIIANGLRVFFTILIGETWGMHYATGTDHMIFGWQFFGTVLIILLLVGWFFRDRIAPRQQLTVSGGRPSATRSSIWLVALVLLVAGPAVAAGLATTVTSDPLRLAAPVVAGWHGPYVVHDGWQPAFKGAAGELRVAYAPFAGGSTVEFFHAVYTSRPRKGHTLITYGNNVYDSARSRILATADRSVVLADGRQVTASELRLTGPAGERLVWYWYCVDTRCTASPAVVKLLQAWQALRGAQPHSSVWALSMPVAHAADAQARGAMRAFARAMPDAQAWLASGHGNALAGSVQ